MSKNGLHRHYDKLEPEERFRLDVLAMARGDKVESERLTRSCPRRSYTMTDLAFSGRWSAAVEISSITFMELEKHLAKLQIVEAFRVMGPYLKTLMKNDGDQAYFDGHRRGSAHAWAKAGMEGEPPGWERDDEEAERNADPETEEGLRDVSARVLHVGELVASITDRLECELARDAFSVWMGYLDFCEQEMGLDGREVMGAIAPGLGKSAETVDALAERLSLEADEEEAADLGESMRLVWKKHTGKAA
jgi:hypothetical protein